MFCPSCFGETRVYDSRPKDGTVWRRRECTVCHLRFTTHEGKTTDTWPQDGTRVRNQRDVALRALRRLGATVREIALVTGLSENYVGQLTKDGRL